AGRIWMSWPNAIDPTSRRNRRHVGRARAASDECRTTPLAHGESHALSDRREHGDKRIDREFIDLVIHDIRHSRARDSQSLRGRAISMSTLPVWRVVFLKLCKT